MLRVNSADEAMALAKDLVRRNNTLIGEIGPTCSAKDVAAKILLQELQVGEPTRQAVLLRSAQQSGAAAALNATPAAGGHEAAPTDQSVMSIQHSTPTPNRAANEATSGVSPVPMAQSPATGDGSPQLCTDAATGRYCLYCTEPTSRYCKETGRRHETPDERAQRMWKRVYRQLSIASSFVNTARLAKKNTCTEDYAVELNLDDF